MGLRIVYYVHVEWRQNDNIFQFNKDVIFHFPLNFIFNTFSSKKFKIVLKFSSAGLCPVFFHFRFNCTCSIQSEWNYYGNTLLYIYTMRDRKIGPSFYIFILLRFVLPKCNFRFVIKMYFMWTLCFSFIIFGYEASSYLIYLVRRCLTTANDWLSKWNSWKFGYW